MPIWRLRAGIFRAAPQGLCLNRWPALAPGHDDLGVFGEPCREIVCTTSGFKALPVINFGLTRRPAAKTCVGR